MPDQVLVAQAASRIVVIPGCGITAENAPDVIRATNAREIHVVETTGVDSAMAYRNPRADMGAGSPTSEYRRTVTSEAAIREIVERV